jgi:hypothetical protein
MRKIAVCELKRTRGVRLFSSHPYYSPSSSSSPSSQIPTSMALPSLDSFTDDSSPFPLQRSTSATPALLPTTPIPSVRPVLPPLASPATLASVGTAERLASVRRLVTPFTVPPPLPGIRIRREEKTTRRQRTECFMGGFSGRACRRLVLRRVWSSGE